MTAASDGARPVATVIIPTRNRAARLQIALRSVAEAMPRAEVIVVDDGSTDDTASVVKAFTEVHYVYQPGDGVCAARNAALRLARGRYIACFDDDDIMLAGPRERMTRFLDAHPSIDVAFANMTFRYADGTSELEYHPAKPDTFWQLPCDVTDDCVRIFDREAFLRSSLLDHGYVLPDSVIVRRSALEAVGGFDETLKGYTDWDLFCRLAARSTFAYFDDVCAVLVKHDSNLSKDLEKMGVQAVRILEKFLDGGLPLDAGLRAALVKRLQWRRFDLARHAFNREDFPTARRRLARVMKESGVSMLALAFWCATWLRPSQVRELRRWKGSLT